MTANDRGRNWSLVGDGIISMIRCVEALVWAGDRATRPLHCITS